MRPLCADCRRPLVFDSSLATRAKESAYDGRTQQASGGPSRPLGRNYSKHASSVLSQNETLIVLSVTRAVNRFECHKRTLRIFTVPLTYNLWAPGPRRS